MSSDMNQNLGDSGRNVARGAKAGAKAGTKAARAAARKSKRSASSVLPLKAKIVIAVILAFVLLIATVGGGTSSSQMDENFYYTAMNEERTNKPDTEEDARDAIYDITNALDQTADLASVIHEAKSEERQRLEGQINKSSDDAAVICESDSMPIYVNGITKSDLDILAAYSVTLSNSGLYKHEDGSEETVENDTGLFSTERYTDINGRRIKTYRLGDKKGRINYPKDLRSRINDPLRTFGLGQSPLDEIDSSSEGAGQGENTQVASEGIQGAIDWAVSIANNNSFTYGSFAGRVAGCYFCKTRHDKHYSCMPFITAAYAHGAKDPDVLALCRKRHSFSTYMDPDWKKLIKKGKFIRVGRACDLSFSALQPGDILVTYASDDASGHMAMYIGGNDIVEAGRPGNGANSISVEKGDAKKDFKRLQRRKNNFVMRYTGGSGSVSPSGSDTASTVDYISDYDEGTGGLFYKILSGDEALEAMEADGIETAASGSNAEDITYLQERPVSYICEHLFLIDPAAKYSGSSTGIHAKSNLAAIYAISDNTEHLLYTEASDPSLLGMSGGVYGTGVLGLPLPPDAFVVTSHVGTRVSPGPGASNNHKGVDMGCPTGTPIYASLAGHVTTASWHGGHGNCVIIESGNTEIIYAHMSKILVKKGAFVSQGQNIGLVGNTGISFGSHLHFEVHQNGKVIDPEPLLGLR